MSNFHYSTDAEWDAAEARELGAMDPGSAWILTDRDVWHRNPYYTGPAVPHPEDDEEWEWEAEQEQDAADWLEARAEGYTNLQDYREAALPRYDYDDIPF